MNLNDRLAVRFMKINLYLTECKKEEKIACGWCMYLKYIRIIIQLLLEAFVI